MRAVDIIQKKRDNHQLDTGEIEYLLNAYNAGDVPDYQMAAFCMAVFFTGMTDAELAVFTECMKESGDTISFDGVHRFLIDKHSTGGVGDKTTLALAPILAAFNIGTAKLSGRGLGHTGGTIDKFESIPGFAFPDNRSDLVELVNRTGIGIMGYSDTIVPLDKKLYSLRDVTATVPSIPLIASSIMSKKLAVQSDGIILDVKCGSGAFMKNLSEARLLAETMRSVGTRMNRRVSVLLSGMDQPLGNAVGNSLEVIEAIETLKGNGPDDFTELVRTLAGIALVIKGDAPSYVEGQALVDAVLDSGEALDHFTGFISACGGDGRIAEDYSRLPMADHVYEYTSQSEGYIHEIDAEAVGAAAMVLGAGRQKKGDAIDHGVGIVFNRKVGSRVQPGDVICELYYNEETALDGAKSRLESAVVIGPEACESPQVVLDIL